jgi:predicted nucleic acid-binding protein
MKAAVTNQFVLDASTTLAWCFPEEGSPHSQAVLDALSSNWSAVTPAIWPMEVANALLVGERRKRRTVAQVTSVLQRIAALPISVESADTYWMFGSILLLARQEALTVYDAAYLELALRRFLPLSTFDEKLKRAAEKVGIPLVSI